MPWKQIGCASCSALTVGGEINYQNRANKTFMKNSFSSCLFKGALAAAALFSLSNVNPARAQQIGTVWYIYYENRNWTQPSASGVTLQQVQGSVNAPYINSLITP